VASNKFRIVIAISNLEFGGAQQQIVELLNNLDPDRFDAHIVSLSEFMPLAENLRIGSANIHVIRKHWKYDLTVPIRLAALLRRLRADVVHGFLFDAEIACRVAGKLSGTRVIVGSERNCDYTLKKNQMAFYKLTRSMQDYCVANSHAGARFNSEMLGYPTEHYFVVHNGVNVDRFRPGSNADTRQELGLEVAEFVIGVFASFKWQKNHELFFRVAAKLVEEYPKLRFLLVGDELYEGMHGSREYKEGLEILIDELNLRGRCVFAGNRSDVERLYRACDLTVLPSRHEGMPNVVLESLASGVPVVATKVADNELLIADGEVGSLVESENDEQMAGAIKALIADDELRTRLANNCRPWVQQHFSASVMSAKMASAYDQMLGSTTG
jgi:glycosyltransferase involved in cell wall biosynthesis